VALGARNVLKRCMVEREPRLPGRPISRGAGADSHPLGK
jgi:hypothetical protein